MAKRSRIPDDQARVADQRPGNEVDHRSWHEASRTWHEPEFKRDGKAKPTSLGDRRWLAISFNFVHKIRR
jgi:hypothetical protein